MSDTRFKGLYAVAMAVAVTAAGCATTGVSPSFQPEPGTTVEVTKQLDFRKNSRRLYIQGGELVRRRHVDRFTASCSISLERTRDGEALVRSVKPGTFTTGKTRLSMQVSDAGPRTPVRVASNAADTGSTMLQIAQGGPTPAIRIYVTIIPLHSEEQPQVTDLTCSYDGGIGGRHLTRAEITDTLGDLVRFYPG